MIKVFVLAVFSAVLFSACSLLPPAKVDKKNAVAKVNDKYLYKTDLAGIVQLGTNKSDSLEITSAYINDWIRQELLLKQAEDNLDEQHKNFDKQIEQYRNSLIIYEYESQLIKQKLDTIITMSEIESYYNNNIWSFQLRENIVLASYVILNKNSQAIMRIKNLLQSKRQADKQKLIELCQENGTDFQLSSDNWITFSDLDRKIPLKVDDQDEFLKRNKNFEVQDSSRMYLVNIEAFKNKESTSPLSFEIPNIRAIILNKRKAEMLRQMEEDLYNDAIKKNKYEIFKK